MVWVLIHFLPLLSGAATSFSRGDPCPMIRSLSLTLELVLLAFCFLVWLPSQLVLLLRSWRKTKIVKRIPSHHGHHYVLYVSCPFATPHSQTLFHFTCPKHDTVTALPVGLLLSKDWATLSEQSFARPFGEVGIPTPRSVPRHRRQGVWETPGYTGHSYKDHTVSPHLLAALEKKYKNLLNS